MAMHDVFWLLGFQLECTRLPFPHIVSFKVLRNQVLESIVLGTSILGTAGGGGLLVDHLWTSIPFFSVFGKSSACSQSTYFEQT